MIELANLDSWEQGLVAAGAVCQILVLAAACWFGARVDRYLREGQQHLSTTERQALATLQDIRHTQRALEAAAESSSAAALAWGEAARQDSSATLATVLDLVEQLHARVPPAVLAESAAAEASPPAMAPNAQQHRLIGQLQSDVAELRQRVEDRDRQLNTVSRERRRLAGEAAQLAGVKATNERLMAELKEKRQEFRRLQGALEPMGLEIKSLRSQLAVLRHEMGDGPDIAHLEEALIERTQNVFDGRLKELQQQSHDLEDQLRAAQQELLRTQREKAFIEEHYLDLAQP